MVATVKTTGKNDSPIAARAQAVPVLPEGWRCFHCDKSFTDSESARLHFGVSEHDKPACQYSIEHIRWMEAQHRRNCDDDSEALRTVGRLVGEHEKLRRQAEEDGYARGLADARKHPEELGLVGAPVLPAPAAPPADHDATFDFGFWMIEALRLVDLHWNASPAARHRTRGDLRQHLKSVGMHWRAAAFLRDRAAAPAAPAEPLTDEKSRDEWQSVVFTLMGHAAVLYASGQHDMPQWFYGLAEKIAREHVDEAHAVRVREVGVRERVNYGITAQPADIPAAAPMTTPAPRETR